MMLPMTQMDGAPPRRRAARRTRAEWEAEIAHYRSSGQSAEAYAAEHGLNLHTLQWWASEVERSGARPLAPKPDLPAFVPIRVMPAKTPPAAGIDLALEPGLFLRITSEVDVTRLARILSVLTESLRSGPC